MMGLPVAAPVVRQAPVVEEKPDPWKQYTDQESGRPFYYNAQAGETSWTHP